MIRQWVQVQPFSIERQRDQRRIEFAFAYLLSQRRLGVAGDMQRAGMFAQRSLNGGENALFEGRRHAQT